MARRKRDREDDREDHPLCKSPIGPQLEEGVRQGHLVRRVLGPKVTYVGFTFWKSVVEGNTSFQSMASNRLVNNDVVNERIAVNEDSLERCGVYMDFGTVILIVVNSDPLANYRIMDGQHRVRTMQELFRRRPGTDLPFSLQVSVVPDEAAAHAELMHFQVHHPADPRAFFGTQKEREAADALLARARRHFNHTSLWKEHSSGRFGTGRADPVRPYLSDYVFLGLLQEAQLLDMRVDAAWEVFSYYVHVCDCVSEEIWVFLFFIWIAELHSMCLCVCVYTCMCMCTYACVCEGERESKRARERGCACGCVCYARDLIHLHTQVLLSANRLLKDSPACRGKNTSDAMALKSKTYKCYLGFLREGVWRELRPKLPAVLFQGVGGVGGADDAAAAAALPALGECCVCLETSSVKDLYALVPCGHRCVCAQHAADAVGRACPMCRKKASHAMRIYD